MSEKKIFVSYRREDSAGHAGRLYDYLVSHFGADQVFQDIDAIEFGEDFLETIERALRECDVLIVIIGKQWCSVVDAKGRRRLESPDDVMRLEIETALASNLRVIPVLVQGATMPSSDELPKSLARLARRHAIEISDSRFQYDASRLCTSIEHARRELAASKNVSPTAEPRIPVSHSAAAPPPSDSPPRPPMASLAQPLRTSVPPSAEPPQPLGSSPSRTLRTFEPPPSKTPQSFIPALAESPGTPSPQLRREPDREASSRPRGISGKTHWSLACLSLGVALFGVFEYGVVVYFAVDTWAPFDASRSPLQSFEAMLVFLVSLVACFASRAACKHAMVAKAALLKSDAIGARDAAGMALRSSLSALLSTMAVLSLFFFASWRFSRWPDRPGELIAVHFITIMVASLIAGTLWAWGGGREGSGKRGSAGTKPDVGYQGTRAKVGA